MRINPAIADPDLEEALNATLEESGLLEPETLESDAELNHIQKIFKSRGAGIGAAAQKIANLMNSDRDEISLRASETALKVQGVYMDKNDKVSKVPSVTIQILSASGGNTLLNLVVPNVQ